MRCVVAAFLAFVTFAAAATADEAAAADGGCTLVKIAEWALRPGRPLPVVDGAINDRQVGVLIDTGAVRTLIARSTASALGLPLYAAQAPGFIGIGGTTTAQMVPVRKFAIGDAARSNWNMLVAGERPMGEIGVVLGADFLQNADVEFDLAHDAMRLFQATNCRDASLAYWAKDGAGQVRLEGFDPARSEIIFPVRVNGRVLRAKLDSGAAATLLMESSAASLDVTRETAGVVSGGCFVGVGRNAIDSWIGQFESFEIGDEAIRNPRIRFADILKFRPYTFTVGEPDMLLGADFLRAHRVLVAFSQRRMYFTYAGGTAFPVVSGRACADLPSATPDTKRGAAAN